MGRTQVGSSEYASSSARSRRPTPSRRRFGLIAVLATAGLASACGSADSDGLYGEPSGSGGREPNDASAGDSSVSTGGATGGASATGGRPGTGGVRPQTGGRPGAGGASTGGRLPTGGSPAGGAAGSGGDLVDSGTDCEAPSAAGHTALCVHFVPERIRARGEPKLDKMGSLIVQVFDGPTPGSASAPPQELAKEVLGVVGPEISVDALPAVRLEGAFPETVYVRAVFVDNPTALVKNGEGFGVWLGGTDMSSGVVDPQPLLPLSIAQGTAQDTDLALVALRRLDVSLPLEITPKGDGEGPLLVTALRTATPTSGTPLFGVAGAACAKSSPGPVSIVGYVVGSGTFYFGALLNDLGSTGPLPPGALVSLDSSGQGTHLLAKLVVPPLDYAVAVQVPLNAIIPLPSDPVIPPNSCADLGL